MNTGFSHYELAILLAVVTTLALALFAAICAWQKPIARTFSLYSLCISAWGAFWYQMIAAKNATAALFFARLLHIPAPFIPAIFLSFSQQLVDKYNQPLQQRLRHIIYISAILFASISFLPLYVSGVSPKGEFQFFGDAGPIYFLFAIWFTVTLIAAFGLLFQGFSKNHGEKRNQIGYVICAYALSFGGGGMVFFQVYNFHLPVLALYAVSLGNAFVLYAILTQHLLNFRIFIRRAGLLVITYGVLVAAAFPILFYLYKKTELMPGFNGRLFYLNVAVLSGMFSLGPFLYAYFIQKSSFFHEHTMAGITHELKSPLATIESALEVLVENLKKDARNIGNVEYAEMIHRNTQRLGSYVNDLLSVFKVRNKKALLEYADVNLRELCGKTIESLKSLAEKRNINLQLETHAHSIIKCDPKKIEQVLSNLISNAIKFTENGSIKISLTESGGQILCAVHDSGTGLLPEEIPYVFDRFFQGHAAKNQKGTGLGLAISKMWVEAHGGEIHAESDGPGKGSRFWFTLPK